MASKDAIGEFNPAVENFDCYIERLETFFEANDIGASKHKVSFCQW